MKKILFTLLMISSLAIQAQITDAVYYERTQYGINWKFDLDTVRINRLHIENKTGFDSLGQIFKYTGSTPAAGMLLKGNGATYQNFSKGSALQYLRVNAGGTDLEYATPSFGPGDISGLTENLFLYGTAGGSVGQDAQGYYDPVTNMLRLGDPGGGDASNPGQFIAVDGTNIAGMNAQTGVYFNTVASGNVSLQAGKINFQETDGDLFNLSRATGSTDYNWIFPAAIGATGNGIYVASVAGDDMTLGYTTFLTAEVDGSITNEVQNLSYDAANHEVDISLSGTSATLPLAVDDGATEGLASFAAADFTATAGNIVIDYANGQAATSGQDGFLQSSDFTTFSKANGFTLQIIGIQGTVVDGAKYYSGAITQSTGTTADVSRIYIPVNCTLKAVYGWCLNTTPSSGSETSTISIRKNNTTDLDITTTFVHNATQTTFNATGLSTTYVAGDYIEGKELMPTFAGTNPANIRWTWILYFEAL